MDGNDGNLKSFLTDGDTVESECKSSLLGIGGNSFLGIGGNSDWRPLRWPKKLSFAGSGGTGGMGGSGSSTGAVDIVDWTLGVFVREMSFVEVVP